MTNPYIFANNASSLLANKIEVSSTVLQLTLGTGVIFPSPINGEVVSCTLSNSSGTIREIVYMTSRIIDTVTVIRAQEGTTALSWSAGTLFQALVTKGVLDEVVQKYQLIPQFLGFISPLTVGWNSPNLDGTVKIQEAIDFASMNGVPLDLLGVNWRVDYPLIYPSNLTMQNGGIDNSYGPRSASNIYFMHRIFGSVSNYVLLTQDAPADQGTPQEIHLTPGWESTLGPLANDDMLYVSAPSHAWDNRGAYIGEIVTVQEDEGGDTIRISSPLLYSYLIAEGARVQKITPARNVHFENVNFTGVKTLIYTPGQFMGGLIFLFARDCNIINCRVEYYVLSAIRVAFYLDVYVFRSTIRNTPQWYGLLVSNAGRNLWIDKLSAVNCRHGVSGGSSGSPLFGTGPYGAGGGIANFVTISESYIEGREASLDAHPGVDNWIVSGNELVCKGDITENVPYGMIYQGRSIIFSNNNVTGNIAYVFFYQPLVLEGNPSGSVICLGNSGETTNTLSTALYAYAAQFRPGFIGADRLEFDSASKGPWAGGVRIQASGAQDISHVTIGGRYLGCLTNGIYLRSATASISDVRLNGPIVEMANSSGTGIALQTANGLTLDVTGNATVEGALYGVRRFATVGTVSAKLDLTTDASNLAFGFTDLDTLYINGYGLRKFTTSISLIQAESGYSFSNEGAVGAVDFALPLAVAGLSYRFFCAAAHNMTITAQAGDKLWLGGVATSAGGALVASAPGSSVLLFSQNAVDWYASSNVGFTISGSPPPVRYAFDFTSATMPVGAAQTRASTAEYNNSTPVLTDAGINVARFGYDGFGSYRGLLNEASAVNVIRNGNGVGGTPGTPGVGPTNWVVTTTVGGLTRTISAATTESGIPCIAFRYTSNDLNLASPITIGISFETPTGGGSAAVGDVWTATAYGRLLSGTFDNVTGINLAVLQYNSSGVSVGTLGGATITPTNSPLIEQRFTTTKTLNAATVAFTASQFRLTCGTLGPIDFTFLVGLPNEVKEATSSSPIKSAGSVGTRSTDVTTLTMDIGTYDISITRLSGTTLIPGVSVPSGSYVVPNDNSPLRLITAT